MSVARGSEYTKSGDSGSFRDLQISSTGGDSRSLVVRVDDLTYLNGLREANQLPVLESDSLEVAATAAAIRAVDETPEFFSSSDAVEISLGYDELSEQRPVSSMGNRTLRRYIARRLYLAWEHVSFDYYLGFGPIDEAITGVGPEGFLRNLQLLEQEEYVVLSRTMDRGFSGFDARGTALLIRDVERYGAAKADVESPTDFKARLLLLDTLASERDEIIQERGRYELAQSSVEVVSVFRAISPILEGVVRRLLRASGSTREHGSLGPMIGELRSRTIGTRGLWSQLNAVMTNGRDISLHGEDLPIAVLRIAAETCFELFPQLAILFPSSSA